MGPTLLHHLKNVLDEFKRTRDLDLQKLALSVNRGVELQGFDAASLDLDEVNLEIAVIRSSLMVLCINLRLMRMTYEVNMEISDCEN
ncbi:hypothetical protein OPV22_005330 [Ensete ventricosum]|uniref:Rx N-terminal domain-containing protein n=1 Tax=Ensete ventricosum TaxID=4639 RepID=A0AAV8RKS2_ENSVE|nr:hypothetical protein OPV22_005330 [Ensete ventricosum]